MSMEDVVLVTTVREEIRGGVLRVDAADIPRHIEVAQADRLVSDVYLDKLKSVSTGQESDSTMPSAANSNVQMEIAKTMKVALRPGPHQSVVKEGDTNPSDAERSVSLLRVVLEMQCG